MPRTALVVLGSLVLVAGGFALLLQTGDGGRGRAALGAEAAAPEAAEELPPAALVAPDVPALPDAAAPTTQAPPAPGPDGEAVRAAVEEVPGRPELAFAVYDGPRAVGGAEVRYRWLDPASEERPDVDDLAEFLREGRTAVADAGGRIRLAVAEGRSFYGVAQRDGLFGVLELSVALVDTEREHRLELAPDWDVVVLVEDAAGAGLADVPIGLRRSEGRWSHTAHEEETDAEGRAIFAHAGHRMQREDHEEDGPGSWSVTPELLGEEELRAPLAAEPPPGPIVFRLPPLGAVDVTLEELDGGAVQDGTHVSLRAILEGEPREISPFDHRERRDVSASTADGVARFEHVQLGLELEVVARRPGSQVSSRRYGPGPRAVGERASFHMVFGEEHPVLLLRAVDAEGRPLPQAQLVITQHWRTEFISNQTMEEHTTDAEGRFRVAVPRRTGESEELRLTVERGGDGPLLTGGLALEEELSPGLHDRGDLVLAPPPVLVAGRVVDPAGVPIAGAEIDVEAKLDDGDAEHQWFRLHDLEPTSDEDGRFEVRTALDAARVRLRAMAEEHRGWPVVATAGETGVVLVLQAAGSLAGSLLLDPHVPAGELNVEVHPEDSPEDARQHRWEESRTPKDDGAFAFEALVPGSYHVNVTSGGHLPLVRLEGIRVPSGAAASDPRLEIDLRGLLFVHELVLLPPDPDAELEGNLAWHPTNDETQRGWDWFQESPVRIVTTHAEIDAELSVSGYRVHAIEGLSGRLEVPLEEGLSVRLVLRTDGVLPEPPLYLKAVLASPGGQGMDWGAPAFDETREIVTRCYGNGRMAVRWILERRSGASAMASSVGVEPEQFVEVQEGVGEQVFEVEISAEELARILADF